MFLDRVRYRTPYAVRNGANNNLVYILIKVNNLAAETSFSFGDEFNATTMGKAARCGILSKWACHDFAGCSISGSDKQHLWS